MAQNIFTSENVMKYRKSTSLTTGVGEWRTRNGQWAMNIAPNPFYVGGDTGYIQILHDEFVPNTQYVLDIWVDVDDVIYNGNNVTGGLWLEYTDGSTQYAWTDVGPKGWIHKRAITTAGKSVKGIHGYYYTSTNVYYRWDSYIVPYDTEKIAKTGPTMDTQLVEGSNRCLFGSGGSVTSNQVIEF